MCYGRFVVRYGWQYRAAANIDLPSFHAAATAVFTHGASPYARDLRVDTGQRVYPWLYPPTSLLVVAPLALVSYEQARIVVLVVNHLLVLAMIAALAWWVLRRRDARDVALGAAGIAVALGFRPLESTISHGQVNVLVLALVVGFWLAAQRGAVALAGALLAGATLFKTYPVLIVAMLLLGRRREVAAWTLIWLVVSALTAAAILPDAVWTDWRAHILPAAGYGSRPEGLFYPGSVWNLGLNGLIARQFAGTSAVPGALPALSIGLTYLAAGGVLLVTAVSVRRVAAIDWRRGFDRAMVVTLPAIFLVAPFSWEHHLVFLLPTLLMLMMVRSVGGGLVDVAYVGGAFAIAVVLALRDTLPLKAHAVVLLWGLAVLAIRNHRLQFPFDRMTVGRDAG